MQDLFDFQVEDMTEVAASEMNEDEQNFETYIMNGKKAFRCTYNNCGKVFKYKSDITRHGLIHSNSRPYYCPYEGCKKSFKRPDVLDGHIRTHTRHLPFECEEPGCNARFTSNAGLKYHLLKHKGAKPFVCNYEGCGRSFMTLAQLKQHESTLKYHKNTVPATPSVHEEEIVTKVAVFETKEKKDDSEYFMPKPRAAKTLTWEIKNVNELDEPAEPVEPVQEKAPEVKSDLYDFEKIMSYFMEENKALKQRLEISNKKLINYNDEASYDFQAQRNDSFNIDAPSSPNLYELAGFKSPLHQLDMAFKPMASPNREDNTMNLFDFEWH